MRTLMLVSKAMRGSMAMLASMACVMVCGCGKKSDAAADAAPAAAAHKIYSLEDVSQALNDAHVVITSGTHEDAKAFFAAHPEYQVCQDSEAFTVAVARNAKYDPKADDIYIVASYHDGKINSMDIGPPQFSVANLTQYCK
jgi:hypothetical protein